MNYYKALFVNVLGYGFLMKLKDVRDNRLTGRLKGSTFYIPAFNSGHLGSVWTNHRHLGLVGPLGNQTSEALRGCTTGENHPIRTLLLEGI